MDKKKIAGSFVDLVLSHDWGKVPELSVEEIRILFSIVSAAGFQPAEIVRGKLEDRFSDSAETFLVNATCPYEVIDQDGKDNLRATGWLNCAVELVASPKSGVWVRGKVVDPEKLAADIEREIERSIPLEPIQLNLDKDMLEEPPPSMGGYFVDHTRDSHEIHCIAGIHSYCGGLMDRRRATETKDALVCRSCYLRILFPKEIRPYGKLRETLTFALMGFPA